jgi:hypothetical protein
VFLRQCQDASQPRSSYQPPNVYTQTSSIHKVRITYHPSNAFFEASTPAEKVLLGKKSDFASDFLDEVGNAALYARRKKLLEGVLNEHKKENSLVCSSLPVTPPSSYKYGDGGTTVWYFVADDGSTTTMLRSVFKNIKRGWSKF